MSDQKAVDRETGIAIRYVKHWDIQTDQEPVRWNMYSCGCSHATRGNLHKAVTIDKRVCPIHAADADPFARVACLDCHWKGVGLELKAQACPVCDGRVADC